MVYLIINQLVLINNHKLINTNLIIKSSHKGFLSSANHFDGRWGGADQQGRVANKWLCCEWESCYTTTHEIYRWVMTVLYEFVVNYESSPEFWLISFIKTAIIKMWHRKEDVMSATRILSSRSFAGYEWMVRRLLKRRH